MNLGKVEIADNLNEPLQEAFDSLANVGRSGCYALYYIVVN